MATRTSCSRIGTKGRTVRRLPLRDAGGGGEAMAAAAEEVAACSQFRGFLISARVGWARVGSEVRGQWAQIVGM